MLSLVVIMKKKVQCTYDIVNPCLAAGFRYSRDTIKPCVCVWKKLSICRFNLIFSNQFSRTLFVWLCYSDDLYTVYARIQMKLISILVFEIINSWFIHLDPFSPLCVHNLWRIEHLIQIMFWFTRVMSIKLQRLNADLYFVVKHNHHTTAMAI